ncbi:MAG TPA: helicase-related protein, partial [Ilumatobacteraceae bacterium]|nr:helicase-related protein [Ilumatobacteraceae bacterium]
FPSLGMDVIFVDEAQKLDDGDRGILLQRVIAEAVRRAPDAQVFFASPMSANPSELLAGVPAGARTRSITSDAVTVTQNLYWVNQVRGHPRRWSVDLVSGGQPESAGEIDLPASPSPTSKRLPLVAVAMGGQSDSNVVYMNGAADAEKCAAQIYDALGPDADASADPDIAALRQLSSAIVHERYALDTVLKRRVAFHYGNMPLLLRNEIDRLFRIGALRYLVCTSTLLEGVNLPCKNVFARGPRRGRGNPMSPADFWNLAGRAGRWGQEFQGNIVCVDTANAEQWPTVPRTRVRYPLARAVDPVLRDLEPFVDYVQSGAPIAADAQTAAIEGVYSFLAGRLARGHSLADVPGLPPISASDLERLQSVVGESLATIEYPMDLVERHAGISPLSMQRLLTLFADAGDPGRLAVSPPESSDAVDTVVAALGRLAAVVGGNFGTPPRQYMLSLLIVNWMRGWPLARLISGRIDYLARTGREPQVGKVIRECMADVEQFARFEAPKYLACYIDVLRFHYERLGITEQMPPMPNVAMLLELGVSRTTELSLLSLGMSRSSAIGLSEFIVSDDLTRDECIAWLDSRDLEQLNLPTLVVKDIRSALGRSRGTAQ